MTTDNICEETQESEPVSEFIQRSITTVEQDLLSLDETFTDTKIRRDALIDKLGKVIEKTEISLDGDAEKLESQSKLFDTYAKLLNDQENNLYKRVATKLKKVESDQNGDLGNGVTKVLQNISFRKDGNSVGIEIPLTKTEQDELLNQAFSDRGCLVIKDHELETDENSVHVLSAVLKEELKNSE